MFTIFSYSINVTVTSQNGVPFFRLHQRAYMWTGYLHTKNNLIFYVCCTEMVKKKVYRNTEMKI